MSKVEVGGLLNSYWAAPIKEWNILFCFYCQQKGGKLQIELGGGQTDFSHSITSTS